MGTNGADKKSELLSLREELEKCKTDYLYLRAEFENYKKNSIKERSDLIKYGGERLVRDLLPVIDNFERALATQVTSENFQTFRQGVEMTAHELRQALQKNGVAELKSDGLPFDPNVHEALSSEPSDEIPHGNILRVFQKAYKIHDKLVRPAQVVVAKSLDD